MSQHMEALARANYIRLGRAEIKREIHDGIVSTIDVLLGEPDVCNSMSLYELITSQPRWGKKRTRTLLSTVPIREDKKLRDLTPRQRDAVVQRLSECGVKELWPRN